MTAALPLVLLQHFTGTLDNWDPAVADPLARDRELILFESAGMGRSTGEVPDTVSGMAEHVLAFAAALGLTQVDEALLPAQRIEPGGRPGLREAARGTHRGS